MAGLNLSTGEPSRSQVEADEHYDGPTSFQQAGLNEPAWLHRGFGFLAGLAGFILIGVSSSVVFPSPSHIESPSVPALASYINPAMPAMRGTQIEATSSGQAPVMHIRSPMEGSARNTPPAMGLFDMFKESDASKAAKDEAWKAQQEMLARRRDPTKIKEYEDEVLERRRANMKEGAELKALQSNGGGTDTLEAWQQLKADGKVLSADDMERDADSSRLGSAGLIDARIDTNLPYIDQGYVSDDQPDLMGELGKLGGRLFGGKQDEPEPKDEPEA